MANVKSLVFHDQQGCNLVIRDVNISITHTHTEIAQFRQINGEHGGSAKNSCSEENMMGRLRIRVQKGINLAIRDVKSSDPYVIIKMGKQTLKTRVVRKNVNPEWNDDLNLSISDPHLPVQLFVCDKDTFTLDDKMGDAEFEIGPFLEAVKMRSKGPRNDTIVRRIQPGGQNCLAEESQIVWKNGKVVQNMVLRLRNVECGEVELQLHWVDIRG